MEREACVCDHGFERSDLCAEIIIIIIIINLEGLDAFRFFFKLVSASDHERDWPPCKVVFFGLATNALNVRNNNNNNCIVSTNQQIGHPSWPILLC